MEIIKDVWDWMQEISGQEERPKQVGGYEFFPVKQSDVLVYEPGKLIVGLVRREGRNAGEYNNGVYVEWIAGEEVAQTSSEEMFYDWGYAFRVLLIRHKKNTTKDNRGVASQLIVSKYGGDLKTESFVRGRYRLKKGLDLTRGKTEGLTNVVVPVDKGVVKMKEIPWKDFEVDSMIEAIRKTIPVLSGMGDHEETVAVLKLCEFCLTDYEFREVLRALDFAYPLKKRQTLNNNGHNY